MRRAVVVLVGFLSLVTVAAVAGGSGPAGAQQEGGGRDGATFVPSSGLTPTDRVEGFRSDTSRLAESDQDLLDRADAARVPVLIKFDYDSIATYQGGVPGAEATSPSVTGEPLTPDIAQNSDYAQVVRTTERDIVGGIRSAVPSATIGRRLRVVFGGVAATVPANQARRLLDVDGVVAVQDDVRQELHTDASPDFIDVPPVWEDLGGQATAGQGVLFGSLDTGVWPEHPSFADNDDLGPAPLDNEGDPLTCNFGDDPLTPASDPFACNDKLVGGDVFLDTYLTLPDSPPELYPTSARDSDGHGTHTSSTAAGDIVDEAPIFGIDRGPISGIAPGAWVSVYKVCGELGCFQSDSVAAVEQAIFDGVDVINFSIGGGTDPFSDAVELAFLDAYEAGVFVATSAGNDGPAAGTAEHLSPWVTSTGASTQTRTFTSTISLTADGGATATFEGSSITHGIGTPTPVVFADDVPGYTDVGCLEEPPSDSTFDGLIVACQRGPGRVHRGYNVFQGGGEGMILYNATLADTETDNHWLPVVHLADGTDFVAFMNGHTNVAGTFTQGAPEAGHGDVIASFSSRGPAGPVIKPDVTAPGVQVLAGHTPTPQTIDVGPEGEYFQAIAGTSMASPHVAGAALLLRASQPDWTPGQIKSALMTTSITDLLKEDETTPADPFDRGAGRIDVAAAADPGLTIADDVDGFALASNPVTAVDVNIPSVNAPVMPGRVVTHRVVTNVSGGTAVYHATATSPAGTSITVSPNRFSIASGASRTLTITIEADEGVEGQQFGQIDLTAPSRADLHLPVAFIPTQGAVTLAAGCDTADVTVDDTSTCRLTATNTSFEDTTVDLTATVDAHVEVVDASPGSAATTPSSATLETWPLAGGEPGVPSLGVYGDLGEGYLPGIEGVVDPVALEDEDAVNFDVEPFLYNGQTFDRIGLVSNGYAVVGGVESSADIQCCPPAQMPDTSPPNNVLAPFWADLTGEGDEDPAPDGVYSAVVSVGDSAWRVFEFRLNAFGTDDLKVFQIWIGLNGVQDISFNYSPDINLDGILLSADSPEDGGLTIGAENIDGSGGDQVDEAPEDDDPPPSDLTVESTDPTPGDEVSLDVQVRGAIPGTATFHGEMTSPIVSGVTEEDAQIDVFRQTTELDAYVAQVYQDLFGRDPTDAELDAAAADLGSGTSRFLFLNRLTQTDEWRGIVVDRIYEQVLDRAPTAGQRTNMVTRLRRGTISEKGLVALLGGSAELFTQAGGSNAGFVNLLFQRLLDHPPSTATRNALVSQIQGGTSRATIAQRVYQRADSRGLRVDALYDRYLHRAPTADRRAHYVGVLATRTDTFVTTRLVGSGEYFDNATN
jgi:hypothetical protein